MNYMDSRHCWWVNQRTKWQFSRAMLVAFSQQKMVKTMVVGYEWCSAFYLRTSVFFFPTCQVRVVRFYVSCLLLLLLPPPPPPPPPPPASSSSPPPPRPPCRPRRPCRPCRQLRPAILSVLCRTSTTTIHAQCSLPDLNHDHPRPVFPAGPQPRPSTPSVPCRTSTTTIRAQCSLPDLNHDHPRPVFPAGPQPRVSTPSVPCRTSCRKIWDKECAEES